jgi:hypothetical protein
MAQLLTQYSSHANVIADTVRAAFAATKVGDCVVEMTAPEESTQGGKLALQHVTLRPPEGATLVVGTLNAGEKRAEIRSYVEVSAVHETRFKKLPTFDRPAYEAFIDTLQGVLSAFGIEATVADEPTEAPVSITARTEEPQGIAEKPAYWKLAAVIAVGALVFGGVVWLWLRE